MKFTIAAGILAQSLSVVSETATSKIETHRKHSAASQWTANFVNRNKRSERDDAGLESIVGETLKNSLLETFKICDPSSDDPDVGILSCDFGYECALDESSALGGICTSSTRGLQVSSYCKLCLPGAYVTPENSADFLTVPGFEDTTCGELAFKAYNTTLDFDSCLDIVTTAQDGGCCQASYDCDLCGSESFNPEGVYALNETSSYTCAEFEPYLVMMTNKTECDEAKAYLAQTCCGGAGSGVPTATPIDVGVPTIAPVETTSTSPAPSTPSTPSASSTSGSASMWSRSAVVSTMGIATVTVSAFVLN